MLLLFYSLLGMFIIRIYALAPWLLAGVQRNSQNHPQYIFLNLFLIFDKRKHMVIGGSINPFIFSPLVFHSIS